MGQYADNTTDIVYANDSEFLRTAVRRDKQQHSRLQFQPTQYKTVLWRIIWRYEVAHSLCARVAY